MAEWSESGSVAEEIEFTFEAIDLEREEQRDAKAFSEQLRAPQGEQESALTRGGAAASVGIFAAVAASQALEGVGTDHFRTIVPIFAGVIAFFLVFIVHTEIRRRALSKDASTAGRFQCRFRGKRFIFSGSARSTEFDVSSIAAFVGDARLSLVLLDGQTVTLPVRMSRPAHAALAARLTDVLHELKSFSVGYRVAAPLVRVPTEYASGPGLEPELIDATEAVEGRAQR